MKEILLSKRGKHKGKFVALVDDEDFEIINKFNWYVMKAGDTFYAAKIILIGNKKHHDYMHCFLLKGKGIDHRDGNGLHNYKSNLRKCTHSQNLMNQKPKINKSSIFKGVHYNKQMSNFTSQIKINGKTIYIGSFNDEIDAAKAYDLKAKELFGEFAYLNFKGNERNYR